MRYLQRTNQWRWLGRMARVHRCHFHMHSFWVTQWNNNARYHIITATWQKMIKFAIFLSAKWIKILICLTNWLTRLSGWLIAWLINWSTDPFRIHSDKFQHSCIARATLPRSTSVVCDGIFKLLSFTSANFCINDDFITDEQVLAQSYCSVRSSKFLRSKLTGPQGSI